MVDYQAFAQLYDDLMNQTLYDQWADWVQNRLPKGQSILELGCGTGRLANKLLQNYKVTGLDRSVDMLTLAREQQTKPYPLIQADMTKLADLPVYDHIIAFNDTLCYLENPQVLLSCFQSVYKHLALGGQFLFDVHSIKQMDDFNGFSYHGESDQGLLVWDSYPGDQPYSVEHDLSIFLVQADGSYHRFDERHFERTYEASFYEQLLHQAGFRSVQMTSDFEENFNPEGKRWFFQAKKIVWHERKVT